MTKATKIFIGILVIVTIIVVGWWILNNIFTTKPLSICGPSGKSYWINISNCNKSCQTDEDCKFTCGCGAINTNETCHDEGTTYDCVDRNVMCENNICVAGEEKIKDETADWKIYKSEEYKYEIKYPNDWIYLGGIGASAGAFNIKASDGYDLIDSRIFIRGSVEPNYEDCITTNNEECIDNIISKSTLPGFMELNSKKEVIINGIKGYEIIWEINDYENNKIINGPVNVFLEAPLENKARFVVVIFSGEASQNNINLQTFYKVLSTFRFLK